MNIRDLQYYRKMFQEKNFTKVAAAFNVSQPTVTAAIQRLEKELDAQLVIRDQSHKALIFTESGKQFEKHAAQILQEFEAAKAEITAIKSGKVRFGLPPIIGSYTFPRLSAQLAEQGLLLNLDTREDGSKSLLNQLISGHLDVALLGSTAPIAHPKLSAHLLARKTFKIIISPDHPLAGRKSIAFNELKDERFIQLNDRFIHAAAFRQISRSANIQPKVIYQADDIQIIKGMVAKNVGISFLTEIAIAPQDPVAILDLKDSDQPEFLISLAYRSNHILTPIQEKIVQLLIENGM